MREIQTLLLIDDNEHFCEMIQELLPLYWHGPQLTILTAFSMEDGITAMKNTEIDIILLDLRLPGHSSMGTVQGIVHALEQMRAYIPVILLSAYMGDINTSDALRLGIQEAIHKQGADLLENIVKAIQSAWSRHNYIEERLAIMRSMDRTNGGHAGFASDDGNDHDATIAS